MFCFTPKLFHLLIQTISLPPLFCSSLSFSSPSTFLFSPPVPFTLSFLCLLPVSLLPSFYSFCFLFSFLFLLCIFLPTVFVSAFSPSSPLYINVAVSRPFSPFFFLFLSFRPYPCVRILSLFFPSILLLLALLLHFQSFFLISFSFLFFTLHLLL